MFWLIPVKNLFKLLQSNISADEIACGFILGIIIGLIPPLTLVNFVMILLFFFLKVNRTAALLSAMLFSFIGQFTDTLTHHLGYFLLVDFKTLTPLWIQLYNMPIVPYTKFYNTVVMGNFVFSTVLLIPCFIGVKKFVMFYRASIGKKVEELKLMKLFKLSFVYKIYQKLKP